jgi:hypothetical protein
LGDGAVEAKERLFESLMDISADQLIVGQ